MQRGYLKLWRKIEDSGLLQMPETYTLFTFLLLKATYKPRKIGTPRGVVSLESGQYVSGRIALARELCQSERQIRTGLDRLQELGIITIEATSLYSVYTIVNYSNYQDDDQLTPISATKYRPSTDQVPTTKQTLNIKEYIDSNNTNTLASDDAEKCNGKGKSQSAAFTLPDWIDKQTWELWLKTRKGKKMIPEQMQAQVDKLEKWKNLGLDYAKALKDSADSGWQGLFEPKSVGQKQIAARENFNDKNYGEGITKL